MSSIRKISWLVGITGLVLAMASGTGFAATFTPASIFFDDESSLGLEGWVHGLQPPPPGEELGVVETGVAHFVACLAGEETPVLTAEHARHVLDITLKAYASIEDGQSHETETTF